MAATEEDRPAILPAEDLVVRFEGRLTGPGFERTVDEVARTIGSDTVAFSIHEVPRAVGRGEAIWLGEEDRPTFDVLLSVGGAEELPIRWAAGLDQAQAFDLDATALMSTEAGAPVITGRLLAGYDVRRTRAATSAEAAALRSLGTTTLTRPTLGEIRTAVVQGGMDPAVIEAQSDADTWVQVSRYPAQDLPTDPYDQWSRVAWVAGAALALLVLTIVLALRNVDGADDRRAALAVGAPPRRVRHQQALEGVVLALLGAMLALPLGLLPLAVIRTANLRRAGNDLSQGLLLPGWQAVPLLLLPAVAAGTLWVVVPGLRSLLDRRPRDQLTPRW